MHENVLKYRKNKLIQILKISMHMKEHENKKMTVLIFIT